MNPESFFEIKRQEEKSEYDFLSEFSKDQIIEIEKKRKILSSLGFFIGKDFGIKIELNSPGAGWHWDFKNNVIRIDVKDLLEKEMDYLRFVICHEGGHRRISRTDFIPTETWQEQGFPFLMNAIEDPRDNNFVAENYLKFRDQMNLAYQQDLDIEDKYKEKSKEKLGFQPKFMQAGFEYIKLWFQEVSDEIPKINESLPKEVIDVVQSTIKYAQKSWWKYPSKKEADESEDIIKQYAKQSYKINLDKIWPEFKKLIELDKQDSRVQEMLKDFQESKQSSSEDGQSLPQELRDQLSEEEQKELEDAISEAMNKNKKDQSQENSDQSSDKKENNQAEDNKKDPQNNSENQKQDDINDKQNDLEKDKVQDGKQNGQDDQGNESNSQTVNSDTKDNKENIENKDDKISPKSINLDSLSDNLKQKIKNYIDSLSKEKQEELEEKVEEIMKEIEDEINKELESKLPQDKEQEKIGVLLNELDKEKIEESLKEPKDLKDYKDLLERTLNKDENIYEKYRKEVLEIIDRLENDLREIFVQRRSNKWESGFRTGKRIDIKVRMQEKAKGVSAVESKSWQKRELPREKDYAFSILVDLSGSMQGEKISETFKAVIVLTEVLNRLSINVELLGFNDRIYEYQKFNDNIDRKIREYMGGMLKEVGGPGAAYNDDGWALQQASERLSLQKEKEKFLIVLSDGLPEPSSNHSGEKFNLKKVVNEIIKETNQKLIGLGIGRGTEHVEKFYPNNLANIKVEEMAEKLAGIIEEAIINYNNF
ncbi:MAG: hypothetical protein PHH83_04540 [Patescibacteria group bacterium]|nr:hypothetical protein [Patescibacteria group bacterium]